MEERKGAGREAVLKVENLTLSAFFLSILASGRSWSVHSGSSIWAQFKINLPKSGLSDTENFCIDWTRRVVWYHLE